MLDCGASRCVVLFGCMPCDLTDHAHHKDQKIASGSVENWILLGVQYTSEMAH